MYKKILLCISILLNCSIFALGQSVIDIKPNIINEVQASNCIQKPEHFNLKGKVKELITISNNQTDTLSKLQFNKDGVLIYEQNKNQIIHYTFNGSLLIEKRYIFTSYDSDTISLHFNSSGQLTSKEIIRKSKNEIRKITAQYSYKNQWKEVLVNYKYNYDISHWDVILNEEYTIQYDNFNRVTVVTNKSTHPEATYEYTKTYYYDSLSRNLIRVSHVDRDAGSNSALNLVLTITYNEKDSTIIESLNDFTIRNSLWTHGYSIYKKLNRQGDVIEENHTNPDFDKPMKMEINSFKPKEITRYSYTYDLHGNWNEKYQLTESTKILIAKRLIEYY